MQKGMNVISKCLAEKYTHWGQNSRLLSVVVKFSSELTQQALVQMFTLINALLTELNLYLAVFHERKFSREITYRLHICLVQSARHYSKDLGSLITVGNFLLIFFALSHISLCWQHAKFAKLR